MTSPGDFCPDRSELIETLKRRLAAAESECAALRTDRDVLRAEVEGLAKKLAEYRKIVANMTTNA